jgi:hypothetical protein
MSRILRYIVELPDQPPVSYNCGLGSKDARSWAIHTAARFGGKIIMENVDGTFQNFDKDYTRQSKESYNEDRKYKEIPV